VKQDLLNALQAARRTKKPAGVVTDLTSGRQALLVDGETPLGDLPLSDADRRALAAALARDATGMVTLPDTAVGAKLFLRVFNPPLRLCVVGAVHVAQSLVAMARLAGYAVMLIDPRGAFANETRFPGVEIAAEWPEEALAALRPDRRTAIVTLAHDPKLDDPALAAALRSEAFYIGALGSPRTHERRLGRLTELGFTAADLDRIHGPVGLDLGGRGAVEIAISILAQMTQVRHRGRGTS
jgi:xanthine dehydrogenase accessory factor